MACCTTIPPLNNKRKSGGIFDLPRSAKQRRPLSSSSLTSTSQFLTSNTPTKSTMFTTAASAQNKQIYIETDSIKNKTSAFQAKSSYSPLGSLWNSEKLSNQEIESDNSTYGESQFKSELMERIRHEAKRLIKRKQITLNNTLTTSTDCKSDSDSLLSTSINSNEISNEENKANEPVSNSNISTSNFLSKKSQNHNDLPIFSMNQVNMICERMIKERETALREQYDKILSQKMSEQYDAFVKFTHEQIQRRFESSQCSYVS